MDPSLCLVTDPTLAGGRDLFELIDQAVAGGVTMVQIRDKRASAAELLQTVIRAAQVVDQRAMLLVNDRVDVFLAARAAGAAVHGVHVGQADLPVHWVRVLADAATPLVEPGRWGTRPIIGLTANTPEHLAAVAALAPGTIDYLGIGVIHATATKADHPAVLGVDGFARMAAETALPCVAIGGIRVADVAPLHRAGAAGVAVVSQIMAAPDPAAAARALAAEWRAAAGGC